jgi:hypothetical protein
MNGIQWLFNGNNFIIAPNQLQAAYTDLRHREELIDFINKDKGLQEPYIMTLMSKCPLEQDDLEGEQMGYIQTGK